jgi:predicted porin
VTSGYFRLYFGADGQLLNGLRYGVNGEMRTNFPSPVSQSPGGNTQATTWFTRRAYGYIGTPQFGYVRFGQGDGPLGLFTGAGITTGEAFSTGAWDGDIPDLMPQNVVPAWQFNDVSREYATNKIVYLSPTFFGFNVSASFAPSSATLAAENCGSAAGGGCIAQASSTLPSDILTSTSARGRNTFEIAARWQGNLGPVAIDSYGGWQNGAVVNNGSALTPGQLAKGVDAFAAGASVTFFGFSVFGAGYGGQMNEVASPVPVITLAHGGGANRGSPKAWSAVGGGQYSLGPWTVGASYYYYDRAGAITGTGNEIFRGWAVGGDYSWAPGFDTFLEYIGGKKHQGGINQVDSGPGANPNLHNTTWPQGVALTMLIRW